MPSEKLSRILLSKSPFTLDEISKMTEGDGWKWIYAHAAPAKKKQPEICFTGFNDSEKEGLCQLAARHNYAAVTTITKHLEILCTGPNPGSMKVEKAKKQGKTILTLDEFKNVLLTGEIPMPEQELVKK